MRNAIKILLIFGFTIFGCDLFGQVSCFCKTDTTIKEHIDCTPIVFSNKAKLYWQFNCDSSWLTFEARNGHKKILYSLDSALVELTGRLGYSLAAEYGSTFLIQNKLISGCCDPPEFILFNKENGVIKSNLCFLIFYSYRKSLPIVIYINNERVDYLTALNVNTNKRYKITLPKNDIAKNIKMCLERYPESLFDTETKHGSNLLIKFRYPNGLKKWHWLHDKIWVDLKKFTGKAKHII